MQIFCAKCIYRIYMFCGTILYGGDVMGEKYTDAQRRATLKYLSEKTDDVRVRVPKGTKERWRTAAEVEGKSLQRFIIDAIEEYIQKP